MQNEMTGKKYTRKVSVGLLLGIVFLPYIFAWFTLRKGHSAKARGLSLGWLALLVMMLVTLPDSSTLPDQSTIPDKVSNPIASPEVFNESIPLLSDSKQEQKIYDDRIDYIWSGLAVASGSTEKLVAISDYGKDGEWETLMTVFPIVVEDVSQSVEGMVLAAKLIQVATFAQGDNLQEEEINDWTRLVATHEGNLDSEGEYNDHRVKFSKLEFPDGNAIITLVIGDVPSIDESSEQKYRPEEGTEVDYSLLETRYNKTKVLDPKGRFVAVMVDGYLRFMSPDEGQEHFISDGDRLKPGGDVEMIHVSPGGEYLAVASGLVISVYDVEVICGALFEGMSVSGTDIILNMVYAPGVGVQLPDGAYVSSIEFSHEAEFIIAEIVIPDSEGKGHEQTQTVEVHFK